MNVQHNQEIDYLRGLAILAVIGIHVTGNFSKIGDLNWLYVLAVQAQIFLRFAVPLFLLISGFVLTRHYWPDQTFSTREFYSRRLSVVLIPYLSFSIVYVLLYGAVRGWPPLTEVTRQILTATAAEHLWFFRLIIELYLLFPLLIHWYASYEHKGREVQFVWTALGVQVITNLIIGFAKPSLSGSALEFIQYFYTFLQFGFYFVLGFYLARHWQDIPQKISWAFQRFDRLLLLAFFIIGLINTIAYIFSQMNAAMESYLIIAAVTEPAMFITGFMYCYVAAVKLLSHSSEGLSKTIFAMGKYSFAIYLIHILFLGLLVRYYVKAGITQANWMFYPILFGVTAIISYFAAVLINKTPFLRKLIGAK